jgi:hypothetical protein
VLAKDENSGRPLEDPAQTSLFVLAIINYMVEEVEHAFNEMKNGN